MFTYRYIQVRFYYIYTISIVILFFLISFWLRVLNFFLYQYLSKVFYNNCFKIFYGTDIWAREKERGGLLRRMSFIEEYKRMRVILKFI